MLQLSVLGTQELQEIIRKQSADADSIANLKRWCALELQLLRPGHVGPDGRNRC
jgi:hypothetical protein